MSEQARLIAGMPDLDDQVMCYWNESEIWWLYLPGCGIGNLSNHQIVEHKDENGKVISISVSPSIKVWGHDKGEKTVRHGHLKYGVWEEC